MVLSQDVTWYEYYTAGGRQTGLVPASADGFTLNRWETVPHCQWIHALLPHSSSIPAGQTEETKGSRG